MYLFKIETFCIDIKYSFVHFVYQYVAELKMPFEVECLLDQ